MADQPGAVASSPSVEEAAKAAGVNPEVFKAALQLGAESAAKYVKDNIQPQFEELKKQGEALAEKQKQIDEQLKTTDPSTRPGFGGSTEIPGSDKQIVIPGAITSKEDLEKILRARKNLPAGSTWKKVTALDALESLKTINYNESPAGDVEDNFFMARFARALDLERKNGTDRHQNAP